MSFKTRRFNNEVQRFEKYSEMVSMGYDPIILDLDGNGVGTVSKFGMLFIINRERYLIMMVMGLLHKKTLFNHHNINIPAINEEERCVA